MSSKNSIDSAPSIDKNEKSGIEKECGNENNEQNGSLNHEKPWYDKQIVSWIPAFSYSTSQIVLLSFVCFMSTGLYNSLSGLGGAGIVLYFRNGGFFCCNNLQHFGNKILLGFWSLGLHVVQWQFTMLEQDLQRWICHFLRCIVGSMCCLSLGSPRNHYHELSTGASKRKSHYDFLDHFQHGSCHRSDHLVGKQYS